MKTSVLFIDALCNGSTAALFACLFFFLLLFCFFLQHCIVLVANSSNIVVGNLYLLPEGTVHTVDTKSEIDHPKSSVLD